MSRPEEAITKAVIKAGIQPVFDEFLGREAYAPVVAGSLALIESGDKRALLIPATKFILDATLNLVAQPEVEEFFATKEVAYRSMLAATYANEVTNIAFINDTLLRFYLGNPDLYRHLDEEGMKGITDKIYMSSLVRAPFFDAASVAGGALKLLQAEQIEEMPGDVIERSTGLLAIAGIDKNRALSAKVALGFPYVREQLLTVVGDDEPRVQFTDEGKAKIAKLRRQDSGCPASAVPAESEADKSLVHEYWRKLTRYLVPEGATALHRTK